MFAYDQNPRKVHKPAQVLEMDVCLDLYYGLLRNKTSPILLHLLV